MWANPIVSVVRCLAGRIAKLFGDQSSEAILTAGVDGAWQGYYMPGLWGGLGSMSQPNLNGHTVQAIYTYNGWDEGAVSITIGLSSVNHDELLASGMSLLLMV